MELHERIKQLRKEAGLSQEELAAKIFVSRTLITKYESGSVFPTEENIKKMADVFGVDVSEILNDEEKDRIIVDSYNKNNKTWVVVSIVLLALCTLIILFSVIPWYHYSQYDYSHVTKSNPTPEHITGYTSIIYETLSRGITASLFTLIAALLDCGLISANFFNLNKKVKTIIRIVSLITFIICVFLFVLSFVMFVQCFAGKDY